MVDVKKHYVWAFDQKTKNDGLCSILKQRCRIRKIIDIVKRNYKLWKIAI